MGRGGVAKEPFCGCSPGSSPGARNSDRCSWNGKESALGRFLSFEVGKERTHALSAANPRDSHFESKCHPCSSRLTPSQETLDGERSTLGAGRQRCLGAA